MTAASLSVAAYKRAFKTYFLPGRVERINYEDHPYLAMVPKINNFEGMDMKYVVNYEDPTGISNTFTNAQTNKEPSQYAGFTPTRSRVYGLISIDNETMLASASRLGAFINSKIDETEGVMRGVSRRLAAQLARNGGGSIGRRSGALSGNVLTLTNPEDVVFFAKGMRLVASADDGTATGHALRAGTAAIVDSVDRSAGTVTSTTWGNITSFAASDWLFPEGDFKVAFKGLEAWIPQTAPVVGGGDSHFGQDRAEDPVRLAGIRFDANSKPSASGLSLTAKVLKGGARVKREGGSPPEVFFMNDDRVAEFVLEAESKSMYMKDTRVESAHAGIGFDAIEVVAGGRKAKLVADHNVADHIGFMLRMGSWKLCSLGGNIPGFLTPDQLIVETSSDSFEVRVGGYGQHICIAPGQNGRIDLDV